MSALGKLARSTVDRLRREDYPSNGICTHHGVVVRLRNMTVQFTDTKLRNSPESDGKLLIIMINHHAVPYVPARVETRSVYRDGGYFRIGYPKCVHDARMRAVARALDAETIISWNGTHMGKTVSVVLDVPVPPSLAVSIENYRKLPSPFKLRPEDKAGFAAFNTWWENG